jgi:opacity protein-like surface antigen
MRITTLCLAGALLLSAGPAAAITGTHEFGVEGGMSLPTGDFSDAAGAGFNGGLLYQFTFLDRYGVGAGIRYNGWSGSDDLNASAESAFGAGSKFSFTAWEYDLFGVFNVPMASAPNVMPYVKAGIGAYSIAEKLETPTGTADDGSTEFGVMGGAGVDFQATPAVKIGIGATYHRVKNSPTDFFGASVRAIWPFKIGMTN